MAPLFLLLFSLVPSSAAGSAVSILYKSDSVDTNILLTTAVYNTIQVSYNFSMSLSKVPISVWDPEVSGYEDCNEYQSFCLFDRYLSEVIPVILNNGDTTSFSFNMEQVNYDYLAIYVDECYQDLSASCRFKNYTNFGKNGMVCMCKDVDNFCMVEPISMVADGVCLDETISTDQPVSSDFELSAFFGLSQNSEVIVLLITRNDYPGWEFVEFEFKLLSTLYEVDINGVQCSTECSPVFIGINQTVSISIQQVFTINLVQTSVNETAVVFGGCTKTLSGCSDSPPWITNYYGCLCEGNQIACEDSQSFNESCLPTESTTAFSISTIGSTSLMTTTVESTTSPATSPTTSPSTSTTTTEMTSTATTPSTTASTTSATTTTTTSIGSTTPPSTTISSTTGPTTSTSTTTMSATTTTSTTTRSTTFPTTSTTSETTPSFTSSSTRQTTEETETITTSSSTTATTSTTELSETTTTSGITTTTVMTTTTTTLPSLNSLSTGDIGPNNVTQILKQTLIYSNQRQSLTVDQIDDIATVLSKSANVSGLNDTDTTLIINNLDNTLDAPDGSFSEEAGKQLNDLLQPLVNNSDSGNIEYLNGTNLGFTSKEANCSDSDQYHGLTDDLNGFVNQPVSSSSILNSIQIPLHVVCSQSPAGLFFHFSNQYLSVNRVYFVIYKNRKTFVGPKRYRTYSNHVWEENKNGQFSGPDSLNATEPPPNPCDHQTLMAADSPVMSGTMLAEDGSTVSHLSHGSAAELQFNISTLLTPIHGKYAVTWWDWEAFVWADYDQCKTEKKGDMIQATCPHLTDFTLIVNGALNDPLECDEALSVTGYVVNGLSIASLAILLVVYACAFMGFSFAKRDSISLSYTISLILFYFVFTVFGSQKVAGSACPTMAAIAYSFFIGTIMMNLFKCLRIINQFVPGRDCFRIIQRAVVFDTISIIVPFLISLLLLELTDFFNRNDGFCWVRPDYIVFATVIPISILFVNSSLATVLVVYKFCSTSLRIKKRGKRVDYQLGSKLANILILQFTLGTPWVLQYFTMGLPNVTAWHYAFTIVLGSQGTVLFLLFVYKKFRILRRTRRERRENANVDSLTEKSFVWLGLTCTSTFPTSCLWDNGAVINSTTYTNFAPNHPNANIGACVYYSPSNKQWYSASCGVAYSYICKMTPGINVPSCPPGSYYFRKRCYYSPDDTNLSNTRTRCNDSCADLASIHNYGENSMVRDVAHFSHPSPPYTFIGLSCASGGCNWNDGTQYDYNGFGQRDALLPIP